MGRLAGCRRRPSQSSFGPPCANFLRTSAVGVGVGSVNLRSIQALDGRGRADKPGGDLRCRCGLLTMLTPFFLRERTTMSG